MNTPTLMVSSDRQIIASQERRISQLRQVNAALVAALRDLIDAQGEANDGLGDDHRLIAACRKARAALAAAGERT